MSRGPARYSPVSTRSSGSLADAPGFRPRRGIPDNEEVPALPLSGSYRAHFCRARCTGRRPTCNCEPLGRPFCTYNALARQILQSLLGGPDGIGRSTGRPNANQPGLGRRPNVDDPDLSPVLTPLSGCRCRNRLSIPSNSALAKPHGSVWYLLRPGALALEKRLPTTNIGVPLIHKRAVLSSATPVSFVVAVHDQSDRISTLMAEYRPLSLLRYHSVGWHANVPPAWMCWSRRRPSTGPWPLKGRNLSVRSPRC